MKRRVLFLCTANSARSQMAEGLVRHFLGNLWDAASAGTAPSVLHPLAVAAMGEIGIDISGQRAKGLSEVGTGFDLAITLCGAARDSCPVFPGAARTLHRAFPDPAAVDGDDEKRIAAFRLVRDRMREDLLPLLREEAVH